MSDVVLTVAVSPWAECVRVIGRPCAFVVVIGLTAAATRAGGGGDNGRVCDNVARNSLSAVVSVFSGDCFGVR